MAPSITLHASIGAFYRSIVVFFCLNALFLAGTAWVFGVFIQLYEQGGIFRNDMVALSANQLSLADENNLATWYSSMLLLSVALVAVLCYAVDNRQSEKKGRLISKGWLVMAAFFAFLSFDELGSLHENAGKLKALDVMKNQSWESVLIVPGIIIIVYMAIFAWVSLRHHRSTVLLMALGVILFVTVPVQEHIEMGFIETDLNGTWRRPALHIVLEEGCELFAALSFFSAFVLYLKSKIERHDPLTIVIARRLLLRFCIVALLAGAFVYVAVAIFN